MWPQQTIGQLNWQQKLVKEELQELETDFSIKACGSQSMTRGLTQRSKPAWPIPCKEEANSRIFCTVDAMRQDFYRTINGVRYTRWMFVCNLSVFETTAIYIYICLCVYVCLLIHWYFWIAIFLAKGFFDSDLQITFLLIQNKK